MKKLIFILSITLTLSVFAQVPDYVPTNGLVGWWPFNGNANDESGNGNNGTVYGATLTADRFGVVDKAYSFDGVSDYISTFRPGYLSFSISFWYYIGGDVTSCPLIDGFDSYYDFYFYQSGLRYATFTGVNQYTDVNCNLSLEPNSWEQIVLVNENNIIKIYSNSILVGSYNVMPLPGYSGNHIFGASLTGSDQFLLGSLDDIGIWNRALTQCEVRDLYNAQLGSSSSISETSCESFFWNGNTYTQSGQYQFQTTTAQGCDSTANLNLTINQPSASTQTQTALDSYTWPVNGQIYTQSGTYTAVVPNAAGCDSTIILNLTLNFTGIEDLEIIGSKKLLKITDLNGRETPFRKNTVLLFIYEDGTVERVFEAE